MIAHHGSYFVCETEGNDWRIIPSLSIAKFEPGCGGRAGLWLPTMGTKYRNS